MNRKRFIKVCGWAGLGATFPVAFGACSSAHYVQSTVHQGVLAVSLQEFINEDDKSQEFRLYIMVQAPDLKFPVAVYRISHAHYNAIWTECTHKRCEVNPHPGALVCPCHGSEFDDQGNVLEGPAEQNLKTFKTTSDEKNLYIHLT